MDEVRVVATSEVKVGDRFRKEYGDIDGLADSFNRYGMLQPVAVDRGLNLLAGGRRMAAALKAALPTVPVRVVDTDDPLTKREVELEENIERKDLEWQEECALKAEIDSIRRQRHGEYGDGKGGTWSQAKTAELLGETKQNIQRDIQLHEALKAYPQLAKAENKHEARKMLRRIAEQVVVQELRERSAINPTGVYAQAIQSYRLGDCVQGMANMESDTAYFAEVDPPYGIDLTDIRKNPSDLVPAYGEVDVAGYPDLIRAVAGHTFRILQSHSWCAWWFAMRHFTITKEILVGAGFAVAVLPAIWYKRQGQATNPATTLASCYDTFFVCRKGSPTIRIPGRFNVFDYAPVQAQLKIHPAERPLPLLDDILRTFSLPGGLVLCPFLGSGATLNAAFRLDMRGIGWENATDAQQIKDRFLAKILAEFGAKQEVKP